MRRAMAGQAETERNSTLIFPPPMEILRLVAMLRRSQEEAGSGPLTQELR
ncbi:hypothetical protein [Streptomyces seoulensis]|nr:hypothetical protein [Streptomyces seoulensis]BDH07242.1 hypothetical protein HEK131_44690 [Streptomyces seoulensis]